jgi:hypothetical protein
MPEIRPLERGDLPAVVALIRAHMPRWQGDERMLAGLWLDDPWTDTRIPSVVAVADGDEIVGLNAVQVRRLRFDGCAVVGACCSHAVVAPQHRGGAAGALMIARALSSHAHELAWTDSTTEPVRRLFGAFGGHLDQARACDWMLVLRPARWLRRIARAVATGGTITRWLVPVPAFPLQAAGARAVPMAFPERDADVTGEDATAAAIVAQLPVLTKDLRLWVAHDEPHLQHMITLARAFFRDVVCRLVSRDGRPIGWYAYVLRAGAVSRVLNLMAQEAEVDAVLGELLEHARAHGSAVVTGRAEPHLQMALSRRFAVMHYVRQPTVLARDPGLAHALGTSRALLTRLDGEIFGV